MAADLIEKSVFPAALLALLGSGLMAGVFFAFSVFIMRALARLSPSQAIAAMLSINVTVIHPLFLGTFLGTTAACMLLCIVAFVRWNPSYSVYLLAGSVSYLGGTVLVTFLCNVPRNDALAAVKGDDPDAVPVWSRYLSSWTAWNHVRTASSLAAAVSFSLGLGSLER